MTQLPPGVDWFEIPIAAPPAGVESNFNTSSDLSLAFYLIIPLMLLFSTIFMGLRLRARLSHEESWGLDDCFCAFAWTSAIILGGILIKYVSRMALHTWDLSIGTMTEPWVQRVYVSLSFLSSFSPLAGKLSLLALYNRFFGHIHSVRWQTVGTIIISLPLFVGCVFLPAIAGPAPGKPWGTLNPLTSVAKPFGLVVGVDTVIVDLSILIIPIPHILRMNLSRQKKLGVLSIFLTGSLVIMTDCVILFYRARLSKTIDTTRDGFIVYMCGVVDACVSIICASMPCAAKVWKFHIADSFLFTVLRSRFGSSRGTDVDQLTRSSQAFTPAKKRAKGPYSLPSTNMSMSRLQGTTEVETLKSIEETECAQSTVHSEYEMKTRAGVSSIQVFDEFSVSFNDPSNLAVNHKAV